MYRLEVASPQVRKRSRQLWEEKKNVLVARRAGLRKPHSIAFAEYHGAFSPAPQMLFFRKLPGVISPCSAATLTMTLATQQRAEWLQRADCKCWRCRAWA